MRVSRLLARLRTIQQAWLLAPFVCVATTAAVLLGCGAAGPKRASLAELGVAALPQSDLRAKHHELPAELAELVGLSTAIVAGIDDAQALLDAIDRANGATADAGDSPHGSFAVIAPTETGFSLLCSAAQVAATVRPDAGAGAPQLAVVDFTASVEADGKTEVRHRVGVRFVPASSAVTRLVDKICNKAQPRGQ